MKCGECVLTLGRIVEWHDVVTCKVSDKVVFRRFVGGFGICDPEIDCRNSDCTCDTERRKKLLEQLEIPRRHNCKECSYHTYITTNACYAKSLDSGDATIADVDAPCQYHAERVAALAREMGVGE